MSQPAAPARGPAAFAALAVPSYRAYWLGLILYVVGNWAEYVTFGWLIWDLTHEPLALGSLGLAQGLPLVLLRLFGGVLADRTDRLRLLLGTQVAVALTLTAAFGLTLTGLVGVPHLLVLSALSSVCRAFDEPSRLALVPQLIDRARLPNAIALGAIPWQAGRVIGPSAAGVLLATVGSASGFGLAALTSYGALALYSRIRLPAMDRSDHGQGQARGVLGQLAEGVSYVARNPLFATLIGLASCNGVFGMSYVALLPIYADWYFGVGSGGYGLMQAAQGVGAVVGSLVVATITQRLRRRGRAILAGAAGFGLLLMAFSQSPSLPLALPVLLLMGLSTTVYLTQISTVLQQRVPDELRGRVMSIHSLSWSLLPLGGVLASGLAAAVDARFAVLVGGGLVAGTALLLALRIRLGTRAACTGSSAAGREFRDVF